MRDKLKKVHIKEETKMTKEKANELQPFDVITIKGKHGQPDQDALVKSVSPYGVFCLLKIQSTAILIPFDQILD